MPSRPSNSIRKMVTDAKLRQMLRAVPEDHDGFTQEQIAQKVGVAKQTISKIEQSAMLKITEQITRLLKEE